MIKTNSKIICAFSALLLAAGCASNGIDLSKTYTQQSALSGKNGTYKVGNPYKIAGKTYYPEEDYGYSETGVASWYGKDFHAKYTANGEIYDMNTLTAAHRTLPLPSIVRVTNLENGRSLILRVNDRGPFAKDRILDISKRGAQLLGFLNQGTAKVRVEIMEEESKRLKEALLNKKEEPLIAQRGLISDVASEYNAPAIRENTAYQYKKGSYFVQAGAYKSRSTAEKLSAQLRKYGVSNIYKVNVKGTDFYRVRLGPYKHEMEAKIAMDKMVNNGVYEAQVVKD